MHSLKDIPFINSFRSHLGRKKNCQGTNCDQHSGSSKGQMPKEESPTREMLNRTRIWIGRRDEVAERKAGSPQSQHQW